MINFARMIKPLITFAVVAVSLSGCGQPAQENTSDSAATAPATVSAPQVNERGVQSIDADGNVAPFGMAFRHPVELTASEPPATIAILEEQSPGGNQFSAVCSACHGADAMGVEGLGLNLVASSLVTSASEGELVAFLQVGRSANDEANVTGMAMPAFSWMTDDQLNDVAVYLKSLQ